MLNRKGQNTAEYAILIALIIAAAVGMQTYVKRGLQGRMHDAVRHTGTTGNVGGTDLNFTGDQYEPYYAESETKVKSERSANEEVGARGQITRTNVKEETKVEEKGTEKVTGVIAAN